MRFFVFMVPAISVVSANFLYQALRAVPDWSLAIERSWFQATALIAVGIALVLHEVRQ
jgi:hypothetical protein